MDFEEYRTTLKWTAMPTRPALKKDASSQDVLAYAEELVKWEALREDIVKLREEYHQEEGRLQGQFKEDALKEVELWGHPKANRVYDLACEYGSVGYEEVFSYLEDLAWLIREDQQ